MKYKENHYVPIWYQERFLPTVSERKCHYLDLTPEQFRDPRGIMRTKTALHRWGAVSCFKETDLYTVKYGNGQKPRPNPSLFRTAMFNFTDIQTGRQLEEIEVKQINYVTKPRALRYVAAAQEDWLYPERELQTTHWRKLDDRYLFMPDPRDLHLGGEIMIGYRDGVSAAFDEFGRRPWQTDYNKSVQGGEEERTLYGFQGEFARLFGPKRRGQSESFGGRKEDVDSDEFNRYHLELEQKHRPPRLRPRRDARAH